MNNICNMYGIEFDDNDVQFELEAQENEGKFISVYTNDNEGIRQFFKKDRTDPFANVEDLYGDYFYIDFYTEYYPYTEEVAVKYCVNILVGVCDETKDILQAEREADNVKDGYFILTDEEKSVILEDVKKYIGEDTIQDFKNLVEEKEESYV